MNPHSSESMESVSNPRLSKRFRFFVPVDFQSEILPKPVIFPKILLVPTIPSRVGFGDRRPRFERVHQVPTFLISQFFRHSPKVFRLGFLFPRKNNNPDSQLLALHSGRPTWEMSL